MSTCLKLFFYFGTSTVHFLLSILVTSLQLTGQSPLVSIPQLIPIRYDVQLQMPTASDKDPLIPTFFGTARIEFQITRALTTVPFVYGTQNTAATFSPINQHTQIWRNSSFSAVPSRVSPLDGIQLRFMAIGLDSFENVTLVAAGTGQRFPVVSALIRETDVVFLVAESALDAGRYTLSIDRFQGLITYAKGIFYRDAGGVPVLGTEVFPAHASVLFPMLGGPLTKTTTKLTVIHPRDTLALANMQQLEPTQTLNEHWRMTRFVQAPNIAAYLIAIAVLPSAIYERTIVNTPSIPIYVWTNKLLHRPTLKQEVAQYAGKVFTVLYELINQPLPLTNLEAVIMNEFNGTHSFGLITISFEQWELSDEAHRIALLARNFARQWIGGMTTVSTMAHFCLQEDLVEYLVVKVVRRLLGESSRQIEQYLLAQYVRIQLADVFLSPGESVAMAEEAAMDPVNIESHCGLKGSLMLESLESVVGEATMLSKISKLIEKFRYRNFHAEHLLELLSGHIIDNIDLAQVFEFWFKSGGIPSVLVEKKEERLRLAQMNRGRETQTNGGIWAPMPLWPLRISIRNLSLPITFMLSQVLELAPVGKKLLPLTNVEFLHLYRVNYDAETWTRILRDLDATLPFLSARTKAQLFSDFCYFNTRGQVSPNGETLRRGFLQLLRDHYEHFALCDFYLFFCFGARGREVAIDRGTRAKYAELARTKVWPALWNHQNYECGGPGVATDAANQLCQLAFNANCL